MIDWTVSVGNLLQIVSFLAVGIGAFYAIRSDIRVLRHDQKNTAQRIEVISDLLDEVTKTLNAVAVQNSRLDRCEADIRELRHGEGLVIPRERLKHS